MLQCSSHTVVYNNTEYNRERREGVRVKWVNLILPKLGSQHSIKSYKCLCINHGRATTENVHSPNEFNPLFHQKGKVTLISLSPHKIIATVFIHSLCPVFTGFQAVACCHKVWFPSSIQLGWWRAGDVVSHRNTSTLVFTNVPFKRSEGPSVPLPPECPEHLSYCSV